VCVCADKKHVTPTLIDDDKDEEEHENQAITPCPVCFEDEKKDEVYIVCDGCTLGKLSYQSFS
jgi:hypothetical protein